MISTDIQTDETMRSVISYGTPEHPICCITDDLSKLKSQSTRWHWHNEFEFSYIRSGAVTFYIDSEQINLQKGDGLFISSEAIHHVEGSEGCVVENLIFPHPIWALKIHWSFKNMCNQFYRVVSLIFRFIQTSLW